MQIRLHGWRGILVGMWGCPGGFLVRKRVEAAQLMVKSDGGWARTDCVYPFDPRTTISATPSAYRIRIRVHAS